MVLLQKNHLAYLYRFIIFDNNLFEIPAEDVNPVFV